MGRNILRGEILENSEQETVSSEICMYIVICERNSRTMGAKRRKYNTTADVV